MIRWFRRYRYGALGALIGTIAGQVVALLLNLQILAFVGAVIGTAIGTFLDERIGRKLTHSSKLTDYLWLMQMTPAGKPCVQRTALAPVAEPASRLQFVFPNMAAVESWYADIRARRQLIPPLQGAPARESTDEDDVLAQVDAFDREYGRNIKLPSEVL